MEFSCFIASKTCQYFFAHTSVAVSYWSQTNSRSSIFSIFSWSLRVWISLLPLESVKALLGTAASYPRSKKEIEKASVASLGMNEFCVERIWIKFYPGKDHLTDYDEF